GAWGRFGAGVARATARAGKAATVVMPMRSAAVKVEAVRRLGATVDLIDTDRITRAARVGELAQLDPEAQVVSPYDDAWVVAGNPTLAVELFERPAGAAAGAVP